MNRRRWARCDYFAGRLPPAARLRPGAPVIIVNLSRGGVLVEGQLRPRAGSTCEFEYAAAHGVLRVAARVVRCFVARLEPSLVRYRTALAFDALVPPPAEVDLLVEYQLPARRPVTAASGVVGAQRTGAVGARATEPSRGPQNGRR